jgi:hypothetical protein
MSGVKIQQLFSDPGTLFLTYLAAAGGWVLIWMGRMVAKVTLSSLYQFEIASLQKEQEALIEEWGPMVKKTGSE